MQYLADLLKKSLEWGVLEPEELYGTEKQVIGRLLSEERCGTVRGTPRRTAPKIRFLNQKSGWRIVPAHVILPSTP